MMDTIKFKSQDGIKLHFALPIYYQVLNKYPDLNLFLQKLKLFIQDLVDHRTEYNVNPYPDGDNNGLSILTKEDQEIGIFPISDLVIKCSQGHRCAENLKQQFYRGFQLAQEFTKKLSEPELERFDMCPFYLLVEDPTGFFKTLFFMKRIRGLTLGQTTSGFDPVFTQILNIPNLEAIANLKQFYFHRYFDPNKHRQLIKIQTVYFNKRLQQRGIKILSLNPKNILLESKDDYIRYILIDPTENFFPPLSPLYNLITLPLCHQ